MEVEKAEKRDEEEEEEEEEGIWDAMQQVVPWMRAVLSFNGSSSGSLSPP